MPRKKIVRTQESEFYESDVVSKLDGKVMLTLILKVSPSLNQTSRWHWATLLKLTDAAAKDAQLARERNMLLDETFTKMRVTRYSARKLDYDNLVGGLKYYIDGIKKTGLIFDDSPEYVQIEYLQAKSTILNAMTKIEFLQ